MNKNIIECIFELENITNKDSNNIINSTLVINPLNSSFNYKYKINSYLGHGTIGHVYLLEILNNKQSEQYVIKISNPDCKKDLLEELEIFKIYFIKNKLIYDAYPLFYGNFKNLDNEFYTR